MIRPLDTMATPNGQARYRQLVIGMVAAILLGSNGMAAVVNASDKFRTLTIGAQEQAQSANLEDGGRAGLSCEECGIVASMQVVELAAVQVTVRMADGSIRSFRDSSPARWRPGERVILIN